MKNIIAIVAAVLLGAVAVLAVSSYVSGIEDAQKARLMKAVAVARTIPKGEKISMDELMVKSVQRDENLIDWDDRRVVTGQVAAIEIKEGTLVTRSMFSEIESRFSKDFIKSGQRAITIPVDADSGFSGMLVPGDVIDILITYLPTRSLLGTLPGSPPPDGSAPAGPEVDEALGQVTTFMMQNITILALDNRTTLAVYNAQGSDYNSKEYGSITIALKPEDAQMMVFARQSAGVKMTFLLRNPDDRNPVENVSAMNYKWFSRLLDEAGGDH